MKEGKHTLNPIFTLAFSLRVFLKLWSEKIGAEKKAAVLMGVKKQRLEFRADKVVGISVRG